ncbi:hypothetical protein FN846DRAFT_738015 [Sphaerosporella brunnea]|uniref:Uncharacterized protein n=1 Tax=Sphaerosporella brunnea TaxID=1250544 RepID=A0A5J5EWI5_9PEZI|nr:hypothetical protein FN846DRAFT_738015 [Sphaerosporella brunnea]
MVLGDIAVEIGDCTGTGRLCCNLATAAQRGKRRTDDGILSEDSEPILLRLLDERGLIASDEEVKEHTSGDQSDAAAIHMSVLQRRRVTESQTQRSTGPDAACCDRPPETLRASSPIAAPCPHPSSREGTVLEMRSKLAYTVASMHSAQRQALTIKSGVLWDGLTCKGNNNSKPLKWRTCLLQRGEGGEYIVCLSYVFNKVHLQPASQSDPSNRSHLIPDPGNDGFLRYHQSQRAGRIPTRSPAQQKHPKTPLPAPQRWEARHEPTQFRAAVSLCLGVWGGEIPSPFCKSTSTR